MNSSDNIDTPQAPSESAKKEKRKRIKLVIALAAVVVVAVAAFVFKPWLLFVNKTVDDHVPDVVTSAGMNKPDAQTDKPHGSSDKMEGSARLTKQGSFVSHEHTTTGTASIVEDSATGKKQLVLTDLSTSNGPDVHVWLSKAPVLEGKDGWFEAGKHDHLDLGPIKGNRGNQVYDIPESTNIDEWTNATLWCEDFNVSFGAAELAAK